MAIFVHLRNDVLHRKRLQKVARGARNYTVASPTEAIIAETVAVSTAQKSRRVTAQPEADELPQPLVEAVEAAPSTRNKTRFRMLRLFANTEEIGTDELKQTLEQSSTAPAQDVAPSAPAQTSTKPSDDGVTYTYYRGLKTAVNRPGTSMSAPIASPAPLKPHAAAVTV